MTTDERVLVRLGLLPPKIRTPSPEKLEVWNVGAVNRVRVAADALKRSLDNVSGGQFSRNQLGYALRQLMFAEAQLEEAIAIAGWLDSQLPDPAAEEGGPS